MTTNVNTPEEEVSYETVVEALTEGLSPDKKTMFEIVCQSTANEFLADRKLTENLSVGATGTGSIATLNKVILPIIRRVLPNVIANEIIGVQPMPGPSAIIATTRTIYGSSRGGAVQGEETMAPLHVRNIAAAYSGNEDTVNPGGGLTAAMESVPGNTVSMEILKQNVEATTRKLSARWTHEVQTDTMNMYNMNVEQELTTQIAQHVTMEIDREILGALRALPPRPTIANTFNQQSVSGQSISVADEFAALPILMRHQANMIATRTRRGPGNWAVIHPVMITALEAARASAFVRTTEGNFDAPTNTQFAGTLNGAMKIYTDTYAEADDPILIGFKGQGETDAATFYCPYVPLTTSGTVRDPVTFDYVTSFHTRYAYVEFTNTATSLGNSADFLALVGVEYDNLSFI